MSGPHHHKTHQTPDREPGSDDDDPTPAVDLAKLAKPGAGPRTVDVAAQNERGQAPKVTGGEHARRARVRCLADIQPRDVEWLWPGRLPAGMVSVLDGPPGAGKSTIVVDIIARLTTGRPLPNDVGSRPPATVVLLGQEDSPEHTIRPRLDAAGADATRVHLLADIGGRMPRLPGDGDEIERVVRETGARLLVVDPVSAYIGEADLHRDNEVRGALAPLGLIADRTGASVLLLRHLRKSGGIDALGRGIGSVAIIALARAGLILLADPDDPQARILAWSKMSVGPLPATLRWRWHSGEGAPRVAWGGTCDLSANEILSRQDRALRGGSDGAATAVGNAEAWLMAQFEEAAELPANEIKTRAGLEGIGWRTVERAKSRVKIGSRLDIVPGGNGKGRWVWVAPGASRRRRGDEGGGHETEPAKQTLLAVSGRSASAPGPKSARDRDLRGASKTANGKTARPTLAALGGTRDEAADAMAEGASHA